MQIYEERMFFELIWKNLFTNHIKSGKLLVLSFSFKFMNLKFHSSFTTQFKIARNLENVYY